MTGELVRDVATGVLLVAGCVFVTAGTVGLLRFSDRLSRIHALTKADNLGLGLIAAGLALQATSAGVVAKLVLVWVLALCAAATTGPLLARDRPTGREAAGDGS